MSFFGRAAESFLPDRDYIPLAMPTTDLALLDVLTRERSILRRYSALPHVLITPGTATYVTALGAVVADATGEAARSMKAGIGLGVVSGILSALGAGASVDLSASRAHRISYAYTGVTADRVDIASLDTWLSHCDLDPNARSVSEMLVAERLYLVIAVLKASGLRVTVVDADEQEVALDVPAIQQVVGAKLSVKGSSTRTGTVTFQGTQPLAIAAKAAQLSLDDNGLWVGTRPMTEGEIRDLSGTPAVVLLAGSELSLAP